MSDSRPRREYHPPTVLKIDLKAEEVLAVGCKMQTPGSTGFQGLPCVSQQCRQVGS